MISTGCGENQRIVIKYCALPGLEEAHGSGKHFFGDILRMLTVLPPPFFFNKNKQCLFCSRPVTFLQNFAPIFRRNSETVFPGRKQNGSRKVNKSKPTTW